MHKQLPALLAAAALLLSVPAHGADTYTLDPSHTTVIWEAHHFGFSNPHGFLPMVEGPVTLDEATLANSMVDVTINPGLITTGNTKFDDHLKTKDFFNIGEYPKITFKSTKVEPTGDKKAKVTGNLSLLGKEQPVVLDVVFNKKDEHPFTKKPTVGFSATGVVKRTLFGMVFGAPNVSDDVKITIEAEASAL